MATVVFVEVEHPDVQSRLPDWNRTAKSFICIPKWVKSLPAEKEEEVDGVVTYRLLPGEHGEEYRSGMPRDFSYVSPPDPEDELHIATRISLPKDSNAVNEAPLVSVSPPPATTKYVERDPAILEMIALCDDRIYNRVVENAGIDDMFWQMHAIYASNPKLADGDSHLVMDFIYRGYAARVAIALRTMLDPKSDTESLWHLVNKMGRHSLLFTRARHRAMCQRLSRRAADKLFDEIAGVGKPHIPKAVFGSWNEKLKKELNVIKEYVDKHLAHVGKKPSMTIPNTDDLRRGLLIVAEVFTDCEYVLKGEGLNTSVPSIQENWVKVFRIPWLGRERTPSYKHLDQFRKEERAKKKLPPPANEAQGVPTPGPT